MPAFLSSFTETEFSWLQKRHGKFVGRGSFYVEVVSNARQLGQLGRGPSWGLAASVKTSCVCPYSASVFNALW